MGFNTIVAIARNRATELVKSPKATADALSCYASSDERWQRIVQDAAAKAGEPIPEGISSPFSFHASYSEYFMCDDSGVYRETDYDRKHGHLPDGTKTIELRFDKKIMEGPAILVFLLNDLLDEVRKHPKTITHMLAHPAENIESRDPWLERVIAQDGETRPHPQALEAYCANKPGEVRFYQAGGNRVMVAAQILSKKNDRVLLSLWTSKEEQEDYLMVVKLKSLKKDGKLKEVAKASNLRTSILNSMIRCNEVGWKARKDLKKVLEKF